MAAHKLSAIDAIHVSVVLEDCIDQLAIFGKIMTPGSDPIQSGSDEVVELVEHQKQLEAQYEELMRQPRNSKEFESNITALTKEIHSNTQAINKCFRRNKFVHDAGLKVQNDQKFLSSVLEATLNEINAHQTFNTLVNSVNEEKTKKTELQAIVEREETSRKRVKQLQRAITENRKEQEVELQNRNELIAHLKDQLQETKAKTSMETKYIKKDADVRVMCSQKKCQMTEQELKDELANLHVQMENEARCNNEIENFLRQHHSQLEEKVEYWMDKYDTDVEAKQAELDALKTQKANDLARLQDLTQKYHDYSAVVEEDKVEKERLRKEEQKELEEVLSCTKIQSWWRGVMVRRQLGPYKPKKKAKGKGKKGKKKK